jgi:hypothetical protein
MAKRSLPNRGYIFEAVWAAAIAARFYKRIGEIENVKKPGAFQKSISRRVSLQTLPRISTKDVSDMLIQIWNSGKQLRRKTQNDVHFQSRVKDSLIVSIGVPAEVDRLITRLVSGRNFSEINDFIRSSASLANAHTNLNYRVKRVAFNGFEDVISVTADGLVDQRTVKADVTVNIQTNDGGPSIPPFAVSCKVPGGEQFAQVSGGEWQKFEDLFGTIGVSIPEPIRLGWQESMQEYLSEDIFSKKYATRQSIEATNIPTHVKSAAKKVYRSVASSMNSNFPKQTFVNYIINGFSNGIDTEVVKLVDKTVGGEKFMKGGKTLFIDQEFRNLMLNLNYSASYVETTEGAKIVIKANGISGSIMQFRYKWENKSNKPTASNPSKTYSMYPRHYLEALDGMFDIDPRTQKISI